jgi:catechol 2,3-dioxygenase-like lactoylglutathione lyase family enzyme
MKVDAILECCLYAEPLEETARFYQEVLGMDCFSRVPGRHAFFRCGRQVLLLFDPRATARSTEVPPHGATGPGHVAFRVPGDRLEAWRHHLACHGVALEREVEWPRGGISLYFRDPAGNSVELAPAEIWGL